MADSDALPRHLAEFPVCCSNSPSGEVELSRCVRCERFRGFSLSSEDWIQSHVICTDNELAAATGDGALVNRGSASRA